MTIAPPSDIVLEVARSADPARLSAALQKLDSAGADAAFADAMRATRARGGGGDVAARLTNMSWPAGAAQSGKMSVPQQLEAVLMKTFVETMMPKGKSIYGSGAGSDMHRSMMAEQLANQLVRAGGIGIAAKVGETLRSDAS